jgi:hypothetical protein
MHIYNRHHPRKRMIQYAVTIIITREGRGVLDARQSLPITREQQARLPFPHFLFHDRSR